MGNQPGLSAQCRTRRRTARVRDAGDIFQSFLTIELTTLDYKLERLCGANSGSTLGPSKEHLATSFALDLCARGSSSSGLYMIVRWPFAGEATRPGAMLKRLSDSTVVWYWLYNALRLASGVILLPLVLHK